MVEGVVVSVIAVATGAARATGAGAALVVGTVGPVSLVMKGADRAAAVSGTSRARGCGTSHVASTGSAVRRVIGAAAIGSGYGAHDTGGGWASMRVSGVVVGGFLELVHFDSVLLLLEHYLFGTGAFPAGHLGQIVATLLWLFEGGILRGRVGAGWRRLVV